MFNLTKRQQNLIARLLSATSIFWIIFMIILTPCMTELVFTEGSRDIEYAMKINQHAAEISLMVLIPTLTALIQFMFGKLIFTGSLQSAVNKFQNEEILEYIPDEKMRNEIIKSMVKTAKEKKRLSEIAEKELEKAIKEVEEEL